MENPTSLLWWITLLWLLTAFHGGVRSTTAAYDAWRDRVLLKQSGRNGVSKIVVVAQLRNTLARLLFFLAFFVVGLNAFIGPDVTRSLLHAIRTGVTTGLIVLTLGAMAYVAERDVRDRVRSLTLLQREGTDLGATTRPAPDMGH